MSVGNLLPFGADKSDFIMVVIFWDILLNNLVKQKQKWHFFEKTCNDPLGRTKISLLFLFAAAMTLSG